LVQLLLSFIFCVCSKYMCEKVWWSWKGSISTPLTDLHLFSTPEYKNMIYRPTWDSTVMVKETIRRFWCIYTFSAPLNT
jgi:hypothetical protein